MVLLTILTITKKIKINTVILMNKKNDIDQCDYFKTLIQTNTLKWFKTLILTDLIIKYINIDQMQKQAFGPIPIIFKSTKTDQ